MFAIICFIALILNQMTNGTTNNFIFSTYRSSLLEPLTYIRLLGHVFGHDGWEHFMGNIMLILILGPMLEEKYGSLAIGGVICITAILTGVVNAILFSNIQLFGASGIVYAFIILSSYTSFGEGTIPITFIIVALIYMTGEVYEGLFVHNNISNLTHIIGGMIGAASGYMMNQNQKNSYRKIRR
ncbi:MAG: rhomboid family intramembrane serine protease [Cellulosilyticaceae bacterium]